MDGKKVRPGRFEVILPHEETRPGDEWRQNDGGRFKVIELNEAARQRAAFKRILRYASPFATNDLTVA